MTFEFAKVSKLLMQESVFLSDDNARYKAVTIHMYPMIVLIGAKPVDGVIRLVRYGS
jgi:hypothetical protein